MMIVLAALAAPSAALAQMRTATFQLEGVQLLPDISHPGRPPVAMTGTFEWSYKPGDFENGSGRFTDVYIPWDQPRLDELIINVDLLSIEFSLAGNWHDRGIDLTLFLLQPLSLQRPSDVDTATSLFEIQHGITYEGHVISGRVVPTDVQTCDLILKFKARCARGKLTAQVKSILPEGTELTIDNEGDLKPMTLNRKGKGKITYTNQTGRRRVSIVECPQQNASVDCG